MKNFINQLAEVKGCVFGSIEYISEGGIPKKVINGVVTKLVKAQMQFNYSYENAVNNRLGAIGSENNFVAESLPWGKWLLPNKVITHKDSLYIRYYDFEGASKDTIWFVDGKVATNEELEKIFSYLRSKSSYSKKQAEAGLTTHQVKPKVVKAENIIAMRVGGLVYRKANEVFRPTA